MTIIDFILHSYNVNTYYQNNLYFNTSCHFTYLSYFPKFYGQVLVIFEYKNNFELFLFSHICKWKELNKKTCKRIIQLNFKIVELF